MTETGLTTSITKSDLEKRVSMQEQYILGGRHSRRNRMFGAQMIDKTKEEKATVINSKPDGPDFGTFLLEAKDNMGKKDTMSGSVRMDKNEHKEIKETVTKDKRNIKETRCMDNVTQGATMENIQLNMQRINTSMLQSDKEFQRDINYSLVAKIAAEFDISKLGAITVARLTDCNNKLVVIDGQHRVAGIKLRNNGEDIDIDCLIFDMTKQEAHDWVGNQAKNKRNHKATFLFNQRANGFGSLEQEIINVLQEFGIEITPSVDINSTNAVKQLMKIASYNIDELRATYRIINGVFDDCDIDTDIGRKTYKDRNKAVSIEAFGKLVHTYGGMYVERDMIRFLREARLPSDKSKKMTIDAYVAAAKNDMENSLKKGSVSTFMARLFVKEFNKHKRGNTYKLDPDALFK